MLLTNWSQFRGIYVPPAHKTHVSAIFMDDKYQNIDDAYENHIYVTEPPHSISWYPPDIYLHIIKITILCLWWLHSAWRWLWQFNSSISPAIKICNFLNWLLAKSCRPLSPAFNQLCHKYCLIVIQFTDQAALAEWVCNPLHTIYIIPSLYYIHRNFNWPFHLQS